MKFDRKEIKDAGMVQFTTEDERWYYRQHDGKTFYSVTWITGFWPKGKGFEMFLKNKGAEADEFRDAAGERGSKIHQAIEKLIRDGELNFNDTFLNNTNGLYEELSASEYGAVLTFYAWLKDSKAEVVLSEAVVYNDELGYAGTLDLVVKIDGQLWIIDIKTSKSVYMSHRLQVDAYRNCFKNPEQYKCGILQVGYTTNKGWKLTEVEPMFDKFRALMQIFLTEVEGQKPYQITYPQTIKMEHLWDGTKAEDQNTISGLKMEHLSERSEEPSKNITPTPDTSPESPKSSTTTKAKRTPKSK